MTAWRKVIFSGLVGAFLFAGCTVTTGNGNSDGGLLDDTGGTSGTGGSGTTGGSGHTGGSTEPGTTVVQCEANYVEPAAGPKCGDNTPTTTCDSCLQTYECGPAYRDCYVDTQCLQLVSKMQQCMLDQFVANNGVLPDTADAACQNSSDIDIWQPTTPSQIRAKALWSDIEASLDCNEVCCAIITG